MFLWKNKQNYPLIITKYPPYLFHWSCRASSQQSENPYDILFSNRREKPRGEANFALNILALFVKLKTNHFYLKVMDVLYKLSQLIRLWYLSQRRPAKAQVSIHPVSPEPSLFAHMKNGSSPTGWLRMHVWGMSLRRTKSTIISWAGSIKRLRKERQRKEMGIHGSKSCTQAWVAHLR